ncbi:glycosyltransferase family 1 protein [Aliiroseovarius sp.]|uniref:glycosyltransferase family 4 protein n=1 Tax=Aliiroseovarius sp. TaxID=1872442 RepID=UPI0026171A53|nr:glycosyltransferase family 1 protein [Aliiroseovarius sp.]
MTGEPGAEPARARCLDLTRLVSRVGRGPWTGVDRVEAAYVRELLTRSDPLYGLVRTSMGFVLLERAGVQALWDRLTGATGWGAPDLLSRLFLRSSDARRAAESDLRRLSLARAGRGGLQAMLKRHLPPATTWLNVGHSNLQRHVFEAFHAAGARTSVLVHDVIPLDLPAFQRPGTVEDFRARMRRVSALADLVIYNSGQSRADAERYFASWGRVPDGIVSHLGITPPRPTTAPVSPDRPYFVTLGTIEPRKNHALLLAVWDRLAQDMEVSPELVIIGSRGWNNDAVFARLDEKPAHVTELNGLDDGQVAALVRDARALLFPSFAEGFGLPPAEALALGTPAVVNDLPVYREILGNMAIYADARDMYSWTKIITGLATGSEARQEAAELPTWQDHFNLVLKVT